jgi:hypothetical protein
MEDGMKKFALIAILVVIAAVLVTCDLLVPEDVEEWTDVEYDVDKNGIKSLKLYLKPDNVERSVLPGPNTYGVRVSSKQRAIINNMRALTLDTAASSHDFFEAVFVAGGATAADVVVHRASWEIGEPAGISGLDRDRYYGALYPAAVTNNASTVFVGKKTGKTLLGVGWLTHINDVAIGAATQITASTTSVTYYVAPLKTWVGYYNAGTDVAPNYQLRGRTTWYSAPSETDISTTTNNIMTFMTATTNLTPGTGTWLTAPERSKTLAKRIAFTPSGGTAVYYPVYDLPKYNGTAEPAAPNLLVQYRIGGLDNLTANAATNGVLADPPVLNPGSNTLLPAIRVFGRSTAPTATQPRGALQVIKRRPTFMYKGRTYQSGNYDSTTKIDVYGTYRTAQDQHAYATLTPSATVTPLNSIGDASSIAFDPAIQFGVTVTAAQGGIFAFTWQVPVFAITTRFATNGGAFTKWFIRPADGKDLYLLDDGKDDGGMVILGDSATAGDDWIQIITTGIGFTND